MESWEFCRGLCCSGVNQVPILQALPNECSGQGTPIELGLQRLENQTFLPWSSGSCRARVELGKN